MNKLLLAIFFILVASVLAGVIIYRDMLMDKMSDSDEDNRFTNFITGLYTQKTDDGLEVVNNVVYLPTPTGSLDKILEEQRLRTTPLPDNWLSTTDNHPFRAGERLLKKFTDYAKQSDLSVIWRLDKDFIIKGSFRVNKKILQTAYHISTSISGEFQNGVKVYLCHQSRSIVFIEQATPYLTKECQLQSFN